MITCYACYRKTKKFEEVETNNSKYLLCEDCFKTYKNMRSKEVLKVGR